MNDTEKSAKENMIRKLLLNETTVMVSIVMSVFWVINWVTSPVNIIEKNIALIQKDIQTINSNNLAQTQSNANQIAELKDSQKDIDAQYKAIFAITASNQAMLQVHLGIKDEPAK